MRRSLLYDFYGGLLTAHQKKIYEDVINDIGYSEIAESEGVSRQAVYDLVTRCDRTLERYEEKLHLVGRFVKARGSMEKMRREIEALQENADESSRKSICRDLLRQSQEIFDMF